MACGSCRHWANARWRLPPHCSRPTTGPTTTHRSTGAASSTGGRHKVPYSRYPTGRRRRVSRYAGLATRPSRRQATTVADHGESLDSSYHLALEEEWREAVERGGPYSRSTLGKSQREVGFIHCSFASQVETIAHLIYGSREDVLLLVIDPSQVHAEVRIENLDGGRDPFPHIYGELPTKAVVRVATIPLREDGSLDLEGLL